MRRYILFASILSIFWTIRLPAQSITPPVIQWQKTFGGTNNEHCWVMRQASDGGYIVAGSSESGASGNKQSTNNGGSDGWIARLDRNGNMLWEHSIGGTNGDGFTDARQTPDGGWLLTGGGSTVNKPADEIGYWVVRLDPTGAFLWEKNYSGRGRDVAKAIQPTSDGGFLVSGWSMSGSNGVKTLPNISGPYGPQGPDFWVLRVNATGDIVWQNVYGGYREDTLFGIEPRPSGGFIIIGSSASPPSGNKQAPNYGAEDYWIVAINDAGQMDWERTYGGSSGDAATHICATPDDGYLVAGYSFSGASGNKTTPSASDGRTDVWLVRIDAQGEKLWERNIGDLGYDEPGGVHPAPDGGFYVAIYSARPDRAYHWIVRLDADGNQLWEWLYPVWQSGPKSFARMADGGLLLVSETWSSSPIDLVLTKLSPDALLMPQLRILSPEARLQLKGIIGKTYVTEFTSDFLNWLPFATNTLNSAETEILHPNSAARRFYRASMLP